MTLPIRGVAGAAGVDVDLGQQGPGRDPAFDRQRGGAGKIAGRRHVAHLVGGRLHRARLHAVRQIQADGQVGQRRYRQRDRSDSTLLPAGMVSSSLPPKRSSRSLAAAMAAPSCRSAMWAEAMRSAVAARPGKRRVAAYRSRQAVRSGQELPRITGLAAGRNPA
ncbi:hypothetical protein [Massilia aerilata]|uniref:Uncharacterized protein n=1 Tax=Massilia aerilata TaxID=453817 RepID=A0ABW0RUA1_9BURK